MMSSFSLFATARPALQLVMWKLNIFKPPEGGGLTMTQCKALIPTSALHLIAHVSACASYNLSSVSFMQVVNLYPDHPKVPDTLYKLGVAYHRLGDSARAMEYFRQVQSRYPQSSAAGLATSYAQEIQ